MPSTVSIYKFFIRKKLRQKTAGLPPALQRRKSRIIARKLLQIPGFIRARNVLIYVSKSGEVETWDLIRRALRMKKTVWVPRMNPAKNEIEAVRISDFRKDLVPGAYGILEPRKPAKKTSAEKMDLMIIPGLGFDPSGKRIGRGLGYFDRFLQKTRGCKIGLAFQEQLLQRVPVEAHDIGVDSVITD